MSFRWRALAFAICYVFFTSGAAAAADLSRTAITLTLSDDSDATRRIVALLKKRLPQATVHTASQFGTYKHPPNAVHVAMGPAALRSLLAANPDGPVVSLFNSSLVYRELVAEAGARRRDTTTAIYAEPAPADQLRLIRAIYKRRISVAAIIQSATYIIPALRAAAGETNTDLTIEMVSATDTLFRALNRVADHPVLLAVPDPGVYNGDTLRNLLIATYRREQAVVGFSPALVRAGALATVTSESEDVIAQAEELLSDYLASGRLPREQFPKYFSVVINDSVARSLNLVIDDEVRQLTRRPKASRP